MWFSKKQKNRRSNRRNVLDVKLRSDQIRKSRLRFGVLTFGVLFGTLFGLYIVWRAGEWMLDRLVYENRTFAIQHLDIQTDGVISCDQLQRWTRVKPGQNLFALDLARVKRDLEMVPLIESVSVERVLPRTLRVRVAEREAVAQVNVPRPNGRGGVEVAVFQIDPEGFVMMALDPRQRTTALGRSDEPLPVLTGVGLHELQPGRQLSLPPVRAALNLIMEFAQSGMAGLVDLRRIDVSAPEAMVVTTGQGSEVTFGLRDLDRQLRRWREIHDLGRRMSRSVASLDLAVSNNVPVQWLEAELAPAASPKLPKTIRKKKNV